MKKLFPSAAVNAIPALFLFIAFSGCESARKADGPPALPDMHNSQISVDWAGTYHGIVPCADCPGIDTFIQLDDDGTFQISRIYLEKSDSVYRSEGTFEWSSDGGVITLDIGSDSNMPEQYRVGENRLIQLDLQGKQIEGGLSDLYHLDKFFNPLKGKRAILMEIMGMEPQQSGAPNGRPHIEFHPDDLKISAAGDCNRFTGSYHLRSADRITFTGIASTRMACESMVMDRELSGVFESAEHFSIESDTLSVMNGEGSTLARFLFEQ